MHKKPRNAKILYTDENRHKNPRNAKIKRDAFSANRASDLLKDTF